MSDEKEAVRCMYEAEKCAAQMGNLTICATYWKNILNREIEARECLASYEKSIKQSFEWLQSTHSWIVLFGNTKKARKALVEAEKVASTSIEWAQIAKIHLALFGDTSYAKICLVKGERLITESTDLFDFVQFLVDILGDTEAQMCLERQVNIAKRIDFLTTAAQCYKYKLKDTKEAEECMKLAEDEFDIYFCGLHWSYLNDEKRVESCFEKAKSMKKG